MGFFKTLKFYFKTLVAVNIFFSCSLLGVVTALVLFPFGRNRLTQHIVAKSFYFLFSKILDITIDVENEEKLNKSCRPGVIIGNHQSTLDILVLGRMFPDNCTVTAKRSLLYIPLLGWYMSLSGTFYLDRTNRQKSIVTLNRALLKLRAEKRSIWIFPEGTRSYSTTPGLNSFKKGAFHLAVDAKVPIVPVVVSNTSNIINFKEKVFNTGKIKIKCLDPISTEGLQKKDIGDLVERTRDLMLEGVKELGYSEVTGDDDQSVKEPEETASLLQN